MADTKKEKSEKDKWEFSDYAFSITGIIVAVLLVVPDLLYSQFGIVLLGGSLGDMAEYGFDPEAWTINDFRALSPLLFLLTTTIVFFQEAIVARKTGGYKGSMFTHTFETLLEEAIYMTITTAMVFWAIFADSMYISWLAGPITWILFIFIFPLVRKKRGNSREDEAPMPWLLLAVFAVGIIIEIITTAWIAFPFVWLVICGYKCVQSVREFDSTIDTVFDILYYAFSVVLMAVGILFDFWMTSWAAFPIGLVICWVLHKCGKFRRVETENESAEGEES